MPTPDQLMQQHQFFNGTESRRGGSIFPHFPLATPMPAGTQAPLPSPTVERDAMLFRMDQATLRETPPIRQKLDEGNRVVIRAGETVIATFEPGGGAVLAACLRETARDTRSLVESALMPYAEISVFGVTPDDRWRAGEAYRPYQAIRALVEVLDSRRVTEGMVRAASGALPGIPVEAVAAALELALIAQGRGE